jgi:hypothetical protein
MASQPKPRARTREVDDEGPRFDGGDASDAQLRIETVSQIIAWGPGAR